MRITAAAPATIAAQKTSRGCTTDELRIPRVITVGPDPISWCWLSNGKIQKDSATSRAAYGVMKSKTSRGKRIATRAHKPQHKDWLSEQPWAGGAPQFLRVLKEEIIPLIDRKFRTTQDRAIHGASMGGLFAAYVLFTDPDLFSRYAITSASVWWDSTSILQRQEEFAKNRTSVPKRLFLSVGSQEGSGEISEMWQLVSSICWNIAAGHYKGLEITAEILPDEYHSSVVPFSRALKALYPPIQDDPRRPTHPCMGW